MIAMLTGIATIIGIKASLLIGICQAESNLRNIYGDEGKSHGICQVQCDTARMFNPKVVCLDLNNPTVNAYYAASYLSWQTYRYRNHKDKEYCIKSAYNAGTCIRHNKRYVNRVRRFQKKAEK